MKKILLVLIVMNHLTHILVGGQNSSSHSSLKSLIAVIKRQKNVCKNVRIQSPISIKDLTDTNNHLKINPVSSIDSMRSSQQSLVDCHVPDPDEKTPPSSATDLAHLGHQHCSVPDCGSPNPTTPPCTPTGTRAKVMTSPQLARKRSFIHEEGYGYGFFLADLDLPERH